jgi:hypothetical protein
MYNHNVFTGRYGSDKNAGMRVKYNFQANCETYFTSKDRRQILRSMDGRGGIQKSEIGVAQKQCCGAGAKEPKLNYLSEPEPKLRIPAPAPDPFNLSKPWKTF